MGENRFFEQDTARTRQEMEDRKSAKRLIRQFKREKYHAYPSLHSDIEKRDKVAPGFAADIYRLMEEYAYFRIVKQQAGDKNGVVPDDQPENEEDDCRRLEGKITAMFEEHLGSPGPHTSLTLNHIGFMSGKIVTAHERN